MKSSRQPRPLTLAAAVGSGIVGGFYLAFSGVVLPALNQVPAGEAVRTMQSINRAAVQPAFMIPFWGTAAASAGVLMRAMAARRPLLIAGAALSLIGTGITAAVNVPLNNQLEAARGSASDWHTFTSGWTPANHARAAASMAAAVLLFTARRAGPGSR